MYRKQYNSDFAVQVTSNVDGAQRMTIDFRNNGLNGQSKLNDSYRTSKTRVCVTVGMMTTGYDCTDILNICMMRPVYSPSEFIQMKGRGTRKCDFSLSWITRSEIPEYIDSQKNEFLLFDFFGNYDFFEKDFDYDETLKLPTKPTGINDNPVDVVDVDDAISTVSDPLAQLKEILISEKGMRIDRDLYPTFKKKIAENKTIQDLIKHQNFEDAEIYLKENILDKPQEFFTLDKLRKSLGLDRNLTISELLLHALGHIDKIKSKKECLDEEFDKLDKTLKPEDSIYNDARQFFEAYTGDDEYREIIDGKRFAELKVHPSGEAFSNLSPELRQQIPLYIKQNVNLERLGNVR
jgi:type I restriction enzyme R subunit